ncbi:hypothetical protein QVD17_15507 [Tagetes erecta]|uniref:Uncharacterized protein n=1 Tax=Tagetes erecta TaxID=13708 RepID=A0AAD8NZL3_TARER|nr:hypothetical protein QVD17_15507 [Tagetes erecta]
MMMPDPQIRTLTLTRNNTRRRRFSGCHRHPHEPVTGFCALCLQHRLSGLDSSSSAPEFRRSKSVDAGKCEALNDLVIDTRRMSCDVRARCTLFDLFVVDDTNKNRDDVIMRNEVGFDDDDDDDGEIEGDMKTMKEIIEMELSNKRRNFWDAGSVFSHKLRKWRQKQKEKKQRRCINGGFDKTRSKLGEFRGTHSVVEDCRFGRRSCDTEPRFSIEARRLSVEDPRFSFDEHRASWDGYMIARTNNVKRVTTSTMENLKMGSISKDGASSGGSTQSISDFSTSNRGSSSSSTKSSSTRTVGLGGDEVKSSSNARVSPANDVVSQGTKLVITEKELKDWHLNSVKNNNIESVCNATGSSSKTTETNRLNAHKMVMSSRWKKVCNLWGQKHKLDDNLDDKKNVEYIPENRSVNLVRNPSYVNSRNINRNRRYSTNDLDSGLLRLYLTPFRSYRRNKSVKSSMGSSMASNCLQLN